MNEQEELSYKRGNRAAYLAILQECLHRLGYDDVESQRAKWIIEREAAIASLRSICAEHGNNDWPDNLFISDILNKFIEFD